MQKGAFREHGINNLQRANRYKPDFSDTLLVRTRTEKSARGAGGRLIQVRSLFDDYGRGDGIAIREISFQNNGLHGSSGLSLTAHFVETLQGVQDGSYRLRNVWDSRERLAQ